MAEDRALATFLELVRIDSPSCEESRVARYCAEALEGLGFVVHFDSTGAKTGSDTGNLIATLPGRVDARTLVLSAHMDCVQPCRGVEPVIEGAQVSSAGPTVLGADDKAGIAAILEAMRVIVESGEPHGPVRIVLTVCEEKGLVGAKALDPSDVEGDLCLVLDADGETGGIVIATPTHYTFIATFHGRAAHAGVEPERGVSAIAMAAHAVDSLDLGRLDASTTANIGTINGGTATNVVPSEATVTGECRSLDSERVELVRVQMERVLRASAESGGGTVDVNWTREYEGFRFDENHPLVDLVVASCRDAGLEPRTFATGGGSDGNIFSSDGVPTLVLSCGMQGVHSTEERIAVADLLRLSSLLVAIVRRVAGE